MHVEQAVDKNKKTFSNYLRGIFKGLLDTVAAFLNRLGLTPNAVTLIGFLGNLAAAVVIATGHIQLGGLIILLAVPLDVLDGAMARLRGVVSPFGAFYDSVVDRYCELVTFGGLIVYFIQQGDWLSCLVAYLAAVGSVMVSYSRARALSLGCDVQIGLLSRLERYIVLIPALVFNLPVIGVWIIAVLANFTALQRILYVNKAINKQSNP